MAFRATASYQGLPAMTPRFAFRFSLSVTADDVGRRVSLRRRVDSGRYVDVVGVLESWSDGVLSVRRRNGATVRISEETLVAGRTVPPPRRRKRAVSDEVAAVDPHWSRRAYLMCRPTYFAVEYAINPWMDPTVAVDRDLAIDQWEQLRRAYVLLGHTVHLIAPEPDLPDMVFAANVATVIGGRVFCARFRHPQRRREERCYTEWLVAHGYTDVREPEAVNEGEGDFAYAYRAIIAASDFRTDPAAHRELAECFDLPVVSVRLVDPRYYHLDAALAVLDENTAAYFPGAFDADSRRKLTGFFPRLIEVSAEDAAVLGANAVSDGKHVVLPAQAKRLADDIAAAGFEPVPVTLSELRKAGGGPKCCTLELRS